MPEFFGIAPGEEKAAGGIRIAVPAEADRVWMHGKWLELGDQHAVVYIAAGESVRFIRGNGEVRLVGSFPAWSVRGKGAGAPSALMTSIGQFRGGRVEFLRRGRVVRSEAVSAA